MSSLLKSSRSIGWKDLRFFGTTRRSFTFIRAQELISTGSPKCMARVWSACICRCLLIRLTRFRLMNKGKNGFHSALIWISWDATLKLRSGMDQMLQDWKRPPLLTRRLTSLLFIRPHRLLPNGGPENLVGIQTSPWCLQGSLPMTMRAIPMTTE